jgi:hypothetical protein
MPETYCHTLIPEGIDFVPQPQQVARFLDDLVKLGASPLEASFRVGKPEDFRTGINPVTREAFTIPRRLYTPVGAVADVPAALSGFEDYDLRFSGKGPPKHPVTEVISPRSTTALYRSGSRIARWRLACG